MVGKAGFEPAASCSRSMRATRLRYSPTASYEGILPFSAAKNKWIVQDVLLPALLCPVIDLRELLQAWQGRLYQRADLRSGPWSGIAP